MKRDGKKRLVQLMTGTGLGFLLGGAAGLLVGFTYYLVKKYQLDNHHPTNVTLPQFFLELLGTFVNVLMLFVTPAVCLIYGAVGGAVTGLLTTLVNRGQIIGTFIGAGVGSILFLAEWNDPSELLPYASAAIPLEALVGWFIAWLFARQTSPLQTI
jgi:uncharacterized membrane protein